MNEGTFPYFNAFGIMPYMYDICVIFVQSRHTIKDFSRILR